MISVAVIAVLLALGSTIYRGARAAARVAAAENNLRQVAIGLELYFRKNLSYPRQGADLVAALAPFLRDPGVFANPLREEAAPGQTINLCYRPPSVAEVDQPYCYVTAFVSDDGTTAVILKTGGVVERLGGLRLPPDDLLQASAALSLQWTRYASAPSAPSDSPDAPPSGVTPPSSVTPPAATTPRTPSPPTQVTGKVNLNPSNSDDFEFELRKPDGSKITRDDLVASRGALDYIGPATWLRFTPKGNGNQNGLSLDGRTFTVFNGTTYVIQGGTVQVHVYNDGHGPRGSGRWWMSVTASGAAIVAIN